MFANEARQKFWDALKEVVKEKGEPFYFTTNKQWAIINQKSYNYHNPCLAVDFLWRKEILRVNIYIENNLYLYEKLEKRKDEIESALGFKCIWKENDFYTNGGKSKFNGENTRRIEVDIPFDNDDIDFNNLAQKAVPVIQAYIEVFRGFIDC